MKLKKITGIALFLFLCICCFFSCNDDEKSKTDINVSVCGQKNPTWLQHEVDEITENPETLTEVNIYSLSTESKEYVALHKQRAVSSAYPDYIQFYLCSGEEIARDSEVHHVLYEAFMQNEFKLIWSFRGR